MLSNIDVKKTLLVRLQNIQTHFAFIEKKYSRVFYYRLTTRELLLLIGRSKDDF
jgi:hypothetical protein